LVSKEKMKMLNKNLDREKRNEFIVEQMNYDYEIETTYALTQNMINKDIKLNLKNFDYKRFEMTLLNILLKKRKENYNETFFVVNVYSILKEVMKKYILLNHFDELTELSFNAKLEYERMVNQGLDEKNVYKQYLEVLDNYFVFLPLELLSKITMIYIEVTNRIFDKEVENNGEVKNKVAVTTKNIKDLKQVQFSDTVLFRTEVEILKKLQAMKDRKVKNFVF
jgi:hypothetical protein